MFGALYEHAELIKPSSLMLDFYSAILKVCNDPYQTFAHQGRRPFPIICTQQ